MAVNAQFRNLAVELWDGVKDADYTATVTIPAATLPSTFDYGTNEEVHYQVDETPFPKNLSVHRAARGGQETGVVQLRWSLLLPEELSDLIGFVNAKKGGATSFTASLPGLPANTKFRIVPLSFRYEKRTPGRILASLDLRKVAV